MASLVENRHTCICILGVGFVGESLLRQFGKVFDSIGFDISEERVQALRPTLKPLEKVQLTTSPAAIARATHFFIAVPTLLRADSTINLDYVLDATGTVLQYAAEGSTIVIESSVPVGTTRQLLGRYQTRYHCGMSPERIDPGRASPSHEEIPKLVSALGATALKHIAGIYSRVYDDVRPVSKPEVAEMTKLFENCYRMVNIAYVNEISDACRSHSINPYEVIEAAASKPFGFQAFYPGLGVGGHCIPVNPYYLLATNRNLPILQHATNLMLNRPRKLARRFYRRCIASIALKEELLPGTMPRILVVGIGFKAGQSAVSGSPGLLFAQTLKEMGCARLAFHDPLVTTSPHEWLEKLYDEYWRGNYVDGKFDGLYICNVQDRVDLNLVKKLSNVLVGSYVHL